MQKLGKVNFRRDERIFGIKEVDRFSHIYVLGKTGTGKSTFLKYMALNDGKSGRGFCLIDPHGDMVEELHKSLQDTTHIYLDLSNSDCPFGYNPFKEVSYERISLLVSGFLETMQNSFKDAWGIRVEHVLRNSLYSLLETKGSQISDLLRLYSDKEYREEIVSNLKNETVKTFWTKEYPSYSPNYRQEAISSIQNKVGAFLSDPLLRSILSNERKDVSLRRVMDEGQILLINLAKGRIGSDSADLLGGFLVSSIGLSAYSRANLEEKNRRPFFLYIDEFQNFTTLSLVNMFSELRKFKLGIICAHQYLFQLPVPIREAIFGNVGSIFSFRLGAHDSSIISKELFQEFTPQDLMHLPNHHMYVRLLIDGEVSKGFSAKSILS
jgi:hypothetical protein